MKLVKTNKDSWTEIDKIVLVVNSIDVDYSEKLSVNLSCNFENISKGRCNVRINEKNKKKFKFVINFYRSSINDC